MTVVDDDAFDADLPAFADLPDGAWPTLLLGNGYSINLWSRYRYDTLRGEASLTREADYVFDDLDTTNFEEVLEAIHHAHVVLAAVGEDTEPADELYVEVRDALFETVRDLHVEWDRIPPTTHTAIAEALAEFRKVFTTNYDLTAYWAAVRELESFRIADLFWGRGHTFNPDRTEVWTGWTGLYFVHGAIHLWQDDEGDCGKWTHADGGNLLTVARRYAPGSSRRPLFVSEGTWKAKMRAVRRSAYLSHCYEELEGDDSRTIVLGHSLSDWDRHIVRALRAGAPRDIAVAVYPHQAATDIVQFKAMVTGALEPHTVHFFDSETHPLGDPALNLG